MILSVGEILADMIGENNCYTSYCGGAPFNVAVGAGRCGANVGFVGKVGDDVIGRFLLEKTKEYPLAACDILVDKVRSTTLAFVSLKDGERDFTFFRHDTADYNIEKEEIDLNKYPDLKILHVGSLMLSSEQGQKLADYLFTEGKKRGIKISFDVNFRSDIYRNLEEAKKILWHYAENANILKLSDDEATLFSGETDITKAVKKLYKKGILVITLGSKGSFVKCGDIEITVPTEKVKPIDTTGAGDAFFGAFLAGLDKTDKIDRDTLIAIAENANKKGADATQRKGAI